MKQRSAFTLIEVLLVIGILVVLGTVSVVVYSRVQEKANRDMARTLVDSTEQAVKMFNMDMKRYPDEDGLKELIERPDDEDEAENWNGPYLEDAKIPTDPWGQEIQYERIETSDDVASKPFHIWSNGPDRESGTDDDIRNWEEKE
jgi:general secretion pathway protein G